ncbi:LysR family transcriptional regulator [Labrys miyagiensis]|uniref:LysR family transcriptional regulator n=1 Tax=Labrys miyagiensis TaxID=346912 RepID=A0ABQ6CRF7_9HYPH|nr:LysR family transcriptional regulator [Labrys miyagiensis]GLS22309.1 LysR family transcriptional regulator [Labrys miyagiensis]
MDLASLDIFRAVAAAHSVTRAAGVLGRAPSNVTTRIQQLEHDLGVRLFSREGKRMDLTHEGATFLGYANRLAALALEAREALKPSAPAGLFRVGSMESTAASRLPSVLSRFHGRWPAVSLQLSTGATRPLVKGVLAHDLDCALIGQPSGPVDGAVIDTGYDPDALDGETIFREELLIVLPSGHPPVESAADLKVKKLAALEAGCTYRRMAELWLRHAPSALPVQQVGSYHAMLASVAAGNAIGVMPRSVLDLLPGGRNVGHHSLGLIDTLLIRRRGEPSPAFRAFRDLLASP